MPKLQKLLHLFKVDLTLTNINVLNVLSLTLKKFNFSQGHLREGDNHEGQAAGISAKHPGTVRGLPGSVEQAELPGVPSADSSQEDCMPRAKGGVLSDVQAQPRDWGPGLKHSWQQTQSNHTYK